MAQASLARKALVQLSHLLNRFLHLDPDLSYVIRPLVGHTIQLQVTDYPITAHWHICEDGFLISFDQESADLTMTGRLVNLIQLCISKEPQTLIQQGEVEMHGSFKLLTELNHFCSRFSADIEGALGSWIGPLPAHFISKATITSANWIKKNIKLTEADFIEFLQEELRLIPSLQEFKALATDIQDIQSDVDRLEAKMSLLMYEQSS